MLARLGFSVVVHLDPEILLIDEVLAVGDIEFQRKCLGKIAQFQQGDVTIVFVSYAMEDIERIFSRVIWIENHWIRETGEAKAVVAKYRQTHGV